MTDSASVDLGGRSILAISQCFNVWNVSPEKSDGRRLDIFVTMLHGLIPAESGALAAQRAVVQPPHDRLFL
jgi:hypothetical protein